MQGERNLNLKKINVDNDLQHGTIVNLDVKHNS